MPLYANIAVEDQHLNITGYTLEPTESSVLANTIRPLIELPDNIGAYNSFISPYYQVVKGGKSLALIGDAFQEVALGDNFLSYKEALELLVIREEQHHDASQWQIQNHLTIEGEAYLILDPSKSDMLICYSHKNKSWHYLAPDASTSSAMDKDIQFAFTEDELPLENSVKDAYYSPLESYASEQVLSHYKGISASDVLANYASRH